jgi:hypothetical protein
MADIAVRHAVAHLGLDWNAYQKAFEPIIRMDEHETIPDPLQNLLLDPYPGKTI